MTQSPSYQSMRTFYTIWFGQLVSQIGSGLTRFGLGVWIYQETGEVSQFALVLLFTALPSILLAPFAGVIVDRFNRRWIIILADSGAALSTAIIAWLFVSNNLLPWHIYLASAFSAVLGTLQWPAYGASISLIVPSEKLGHANGLGELARSLSQLVAPVMAGFLLAVIQIQGIIIIDFVTFLIALVTLLVVRFPDHRENATEETGDETFLQAAAFGWRYIKERPALLSLLLYFALINFLVSGTEVLVTPLVLAFTTADVLGSLLFVGGIGMVLGSVLMSAWGGPDQKIVGVIVPQIIGGLGLCVVGLTTNFYVLGVAAFVIFFGIPIGDSCTNVIFQRKVAPEVQGRVFALIGAVSGAIVPFSYIITGWLADAFFEPAMMEGGFLASSLGPIFGIGQGRGIGVLFVVLGVLSCVVSIAALFYPRLRRIETDIPNVQLPTQQPPQQTPQPQEQLAFSQPETANMD